MQPKACYPKIYKGITPHANVKPGAASRDIAAAKETCSGTNY